MTIIQELIQCGCIKEGTFQLKNGEISKHYFDMKLLISYPQLLKKIGDRIYEKIKEKECDLICGVPIGGIPVCSYVSTAYEIPMIMVRKEQKEYGTNKQIEGRYQKKSKCIIIEDVITTGSSVQKTIDILKDKVDVIGVVVIVDRQQDCSCSVPVESLFKKTEIVND